VLGLQGHEPILKKWDTVRIYLLKNKKAKAATSLFCPKELRSRKDFHNFFFWI
jgi:hypothetical protein